MVNTLLSRTATKSVTFIVAEVLLYRISNANQTDPSVVFFLPFLPSPPSQPVTIVRKKELELKGYGEEVAAVERPR